MSKRDGRIKAALEAFEVLKPARTPIFDADGYVRFNGFYDVMTGKLNRTYLRVSAVRRLYDRKRIDAATAKARLRGFVPRGLETAVVEQWKGIA